MVANMDEDIRFDDADKAGPDEASPPLRLRTYERPEGTFVQVEGDLDVETVERLRSALNNACDAAEQRPAGPSPGPYARPAVVVDLRGVGFLDSAGLALLTRTHAEHLGRCDVALLLARGSHPAYVVGLCRLGRAMPVACTPAELVTYLSLAQFPAAPLRA